MHHTHAPHLIDAVFKRRIAAAVTWSSTNKDADITLSGGNLVATGTAAGSVWATLSRSTGKYYFELTQGDDSGQNYGGIMGAATSFTDNAPPDVGTEADYSSGGACTVNGGGGTGFSGSNWVTGSVLGVAVDLTNNLIYFSVAGTYQNSGNPSAGTGGTTITGGTYYPAWGRRALGGASLFVTANFGGSAFNTAAPTGYTAWSG